MVHFSCSIRVDQPARYTLQVQGRIERDMSDWFQEIAEYSYQPGDPVTGRPGVTRLTGILSDQPALHGLLNLIRDLGLTLLYVECLDARRDVNNTGPTTGKVKTKNNNDQELE
jgi:hypothetical protein